MLSAIKMLSLINDIDKLIKFPLSNIITLVKRGLIKDIFVVTALGLQYHFVFLGLSIKNQKNYSRL